MATYVKYQRVRFEKLNQWINERVTLVGQLTGIGSPELKFQCGTTDDTFVNLNSFKLGDESYKDGSWVEVRGIVQDPNSITVEDHNDFGGASFNLETYNQMVSLMDYNVYS